MYLGYIRTKQVLQARGSQISETGTLRIKFKRREITKRNTNDLKLWPHSDMQCDSSTANKEIPTFSNFDQKLQK
jgi:hypothetical protein